MIELNTKFNKFKEAYESKPEYFTETKIVCPHCNNSIMVIEMEGKVKAATKIVTKEMLEEQWKTLPKGWTKESLDKFAKSLTGKTKGDHKGFIRACIPKMQGKVDDPAKFCASLKDRYLGTTKWRSE